VITLFPVGKTQLIPLENAKAVESVLDDLPFCEIARVLREVLKSSVNRRFCGFDSSFELVAVHLYESLLVLMLPCRVKDLGR